MPDLFMSILHLRYSFIIFLVVIKVFKTELLRDTRGKISPTKWNLCNIKSLFFCDYWQEKVSKDLYQLCLIHSVFVCVCMNHSKLSFEKSSLVWNYIYLSLKRCRWSSMKRYHPSTQCKYLTLDPQGFKCDRCKFLCPHLFLYPHISVKSWAPSEQDVCLETQG